MFTSPSGSLRRSTRSTARPGFPAAVVAVCAMLMTVLIVSPAGVQAQEAPPPGNLIVSNAFENTRFSVFVDDTIEIDAKALRILGEEPLNPGVHTVDVFAEGGAPTSGSPLLTQDVTIESGEDLSFIIHPNAAGDLATTVFTNRTEMTGAGESRLVVRHAAQFGPVDVELRPKPNAPMASEGTTDEFTLSNGQQGTVVDINATEGLLYDLIIREQGSTQPFIIDSEVEFVPGEELIVILAGDPPRSESAQDPESLLQRSAEVGAMPPPQIYVVNGFSAGQYDFYIDGQLSRGGIEAKRRSGVLQATPGMGENISEGTYTIDVYPKEGGPAQGGTPTAIASIDIGVCDGRSYSLAVHPDPAGDETLTFFENDVRPPGPMNTRITVRHIGEAADLDVNVAGNGENSSPASTANFQLANGGEEVLNDFLVNDYLIEAFEAGPGNVKVAANDNAEAEGGAPIVAYILGSPPQPSPPGDSLIAYEVPTIPGAPAPGTECAQSTGGTDGGTTNPPVDPPTDPSVDTAKFTPITPNRALDTRTTGGPIPNGESVTVDAGALADVPSDAVAVTVNLTAVNVEGTGFLTATPERLTAAPQVSNVNFTAAGQTRAATNTVPLAADGTFSVYVAGGAHVLADITGYYTPAAESDDGRLVPIQPERAFDTRISPSPSAPVDAGTPLTFDLDTTTSIPESGVTAVVLNVTAARMATRGFLEVRPGGAGVTGTSTLNFVPGVAVPNQSIVPVGPSNTVTFETSATADIIVDVYGYYTDGSAETATSGLFVPVDPVRAVDTRTATPPTGLVGPDGSITVDAATALGVEATEILAIDATVAAIRPDARTFLSVFPTGTTQPNTSVLNVETGDIRANSATVLTEDGAFDVYSRAATNVIVDLAGYFTP